MTIYWKGTISEINIIQEHLNKAESFLFNEASDKKIYQDLSNADLFLICPSVEDPIKVVQELVRKDQFLSIIIFTETGRYQQMRKSIQFSLSVGKNTTCVIFNRETDYSSVFVSAATRTRHKRTYNKFKFERQPKLSELTRAAIKLENLGDILEHAPIGAVLLNPDFTIVGANKTSREMFQELRQGPIALSAVFPRKEFETITRHIAERNEAVFSLVGANGNHFDVSVFRFSDDGANNAILLINDVTERRLKDKRIEEILESLPQMAWTTSPEGEVTFFSQGWYNYTNLSPSQSMASQWLAAVYPDDVPPLVKRWQEALRNGTSYQQASRFKNASGQYRWHLTRAVPIFSTNRQILMWVGTSTDIHEQVLLTENLERKVKERTRTLEEKNTELEQFAHISSHDLQEPLRKIQTFAHILKDAGSELTDEMFYRYIDKIINTSARMSRLIRDLLNFTRIDQGEQVQLLDLNTVISQILEDLEVMITQTSAVIERSDLPLIHARPLQIKQLFYNIITNSIKFRKPDTSPRITITSRKLAPEDRPKHGNLSEGEYYEIIMKDNGIGFDQKYADQIFTVFQRLHTRSAYEGTGIGLSIAKKVIANHGGDIFAISSPGEGAEFHIIMPETSADIVAPVS